MTEDYYTILNVSKNATSAEIKKSYRKLAIKWHPDKNQGDESAETQFKKISEAYEVLSDESKRAQYDQFGHAAFQQNAGQGAQHGHTNPFDIFNSFFGGAGSHPRGNPGGGFDGFFTRDGPGKTQSNQPGSNLKMDVNVKLKDIIKEKSINLSYSRDDQCHRCDGTGKTANSTQVPCGQCGGRGVIYRNMGIMQVEQPCHACGGQGMSIRNPCGGCAGRGVVNKKVNTSVKIPMGVHSGMKLRVSAMGNYDKGGFGDLYVFISIKEDGIYDRDGDDLIRKIGINFDEMILGTEKKIDSLYGKVKIKIPKLSKPETVLRISDHGIPNMNTHNKGDLYLILQPEFPNTLSTERAAILSLFKKTK